MTSLVRGSLTLALLFVGGAARASDKPLYQPAPAWIVAPPEPDFAKLTDSDPALVVLDLQQRVAEHRVWAYSDQAIRVVSAQMLGEIGQLKLPWQPGQGDLIVHAVEIVRGGEHIDLLAQGQRFQVLQREEQLEQLQLNGMLTATLSVEGLRVGDVLRVRYSTTSLDKALQGNAQTVMPLLGDPARAGFARARLSWPVGSPLEWRSYAEGATPRVTQRDGYTELELPLPLAKQPEMPNDAPPRFRKLPLLEAASFADWQSVSRVMAPLYRTDGLIAPGSPLAGEVAKIAARSPDPRVRAALALQLVQDEIRYLFRGMDGGNYIPQTPTQTWTARFGDCKAKTLLLLALLRGLGIEAEPVLASTGMGDFVPQRLPSAAAFDHVIVRAEIGGASLWLDGTGSGARLADLDDTPPFRTVLPLREAGAGLMPLPMRAPGRPMMEVDILLDQRAGLSLPMPYTISYTLRGPMAEALRTASSQANKEMLDNMAEGMVSGILGSTAISDRSVRYDAATATGTMTASGIASTGWHKTERRYRFGLDKTVNELNFEPDRARPAWKDIPVATAAQVSVAYRERVRLPQNGAGFALEGDTTLPPTMVGAIVKRRATLNGGEALVEDRIDNIGTEIAPADIPAERAKVALAKTRLLEIVAPEDYPTRWKVVQAAERGNAFAPILAAYAKSIAADPEEATGYSNRANFNLGIWNRKAALPDLDKAIALAPSAALHLQRAQARLALRQDAAALADAQAALAIDPSDSEAATLVATLRFRAGERDAALAQLAERIAAGGKEKNGYVSAQALLLAEAGRSDEAIAAMDAIIKANPGKADLLNDRCWLKGTTNAVLDTALKDCTRGIELAENPASIYDSRALVYFRMGRMEEAIADLDAALDVAPDMPASLYLRGVIRSRGGDKGGAEDLMAARLMEPRIDEDYARYGIKP